MNAVMRKLAHALCGVLIGCAAFGAYAADRQLLPGDLLSPTSTPRDALKKAPPRRIGVSACRSPASATDGSCR